MCYSRIEAGFAIIASVIFAGCGSIPTTKSVPPNTQVSGRILDTSGKPIAGAVVYASRRKLVGGDIHSSPRWVKSTPSSQFNTDAFGNYFGMLPYSDHFRIQWKKEYVFYFACKKGYRPVRIYFPKRGVVVMLRIDERQNWGDDDIAWQSIISSEGCL